MRSFALRALFSALIFTCYLTGVAQNQWTWMSGSTNNQTMLPVYGTKGVAAPANTPGNRENAVTWTDTNGNLWLFGGYNNGFRGDLWKYDPLTNQWTWMHGTNGTGVTGVYGTQGTPAANNRPGTRIWSNGWTDTNGDFWLYGGYGYSASTGTTYLSDLWKYTVSSNEWTWIKGASAGFSQIVPGTQGVPATSNDPGNRFHYHAARDNNGNFWLFGGLTETPSNTLFLNDLWKYDIASNTWTWMKGTPTATIMGTYGTMGVPAPANTPGSRSKGALIGDNSGHLYMFAGVGAGGSMGMNDLWKYDIASNNWTWISGSGGAVTAASYGFQGVPSAANMPRARTIWGARSFMMDSNGNFWVFGGVDSWASGFLNDVWRFSPTSNQWTWMKGSSGVDQVGTYGTMGVTAQSNTPGGRYAQPAWKDNNGKMWVYGGNGYNASSQGFLNDMWRFDLCDIPGSPKATTPLSQLKICNGNAATLTATLANAPVVWYSALTATSTVGSGSTFITPTLSASGTSSVYTFYAGGTVACGASYARASLEVTVSPSPVLQISSSSPTMCAGEDATVTMSGASLYSLADASSTVGGVGLTWVQVISPLVTTSYTLTGENQQGCSSVQHFVQNVDACTGIADVFRNTAVHVYPNPHHDHFVIRLPGVIKHCSLEVLSVTGQLLLKEKIDAPEHLVNTAHLSAGVYYLKILIGDRIIGVGKVIRSE